MELGSWLSMVEVISKVSGELGGNMGNGSVLGGLRGMLEDEVGIHLGRSYHCEVYVWYS
jgi:hypothetical protein